MAATLLPTSPIGWDSARSQLWAVAHTQRTSLPPSQSLSALLQEAFSLSEMSYCRCSHPSTSIPSLPPPTSSQRLIVHVDSTMCRLHSYFQYMGSTYPPRQRTARWDLPNWPAPTSLPPPPVSCFPSSTTSFRCRFAAIASDWFHHRAAPAAQGSSKTWSTCSSPFPHLCRRGLS